MFLGHLVFHTINPPHTLSDLQVACVLLAIVDRDVLSELIVWKRSTDAAAGAVGRAQPRTRAAIADIPGRQQHCGAALPRAALPCPPHRLRPSLQVRPHLPPPSLIQLVESALHVGQSNLLALLCFHCTCRS